MTSKNTKVAISAAVIIGVAVVSFAGGMFYGKATRKAGPCNFAGRQMDGQMRAGRQLANQGGFAAGEIISKDDKSITVKLQNGGSKIIFFGESTTVGKSVAGALTDLIVGQNVMVNGSVNSDTSITAKTIQIRPAGEAQPNRPPVPDQGQMPGDQVPAGQEPPAPVQ